MSHLAAPLARLIEQFERLPGIGHKSAQRLAFHILNMSEKGAEEFTAAITEAREKIHECARCCNLTEQELCPVCRADGRDTTTICVVEDARDVLAFERTREYRGSYHVLHGTISPMDGVGPEQLRIKQLLNRIADEDITEIIMATNPTVEGEATAMYISKLLAPFGVKVTRLAYGIPVGGDLEYADEVTLRRSLEGRNPL
ncbi:MAG: recombination protein RecR [Clostridiales bacterium]|jgi:recombination protein RecR|nr:recombination protein RecR [Clostridiales bacterium]